tara:strand:- start:232 stop:426 length:195 start_codon:yes stop_codon:yes gene_type:complete
MIGYRDVPTTKKKDFKMNINKTKKELEDIVFLLAYAKRDFKSASYKTYWAAWSALNEMYNRGDA